MPKVEVNGVQIAYELSGDGPPIVFTAGARLPRGSHGYLFAGRMNCDHRVLMWDRRNCGASDFAIDDSPTEFHAYTDDLHALLHELNLAPAYVAGGSGGLVVSILMAYRYPEDVKGLILLSPGTDDFSLWSGLVDGWYHDLADAADDGGMQAVLDYSANPTNAASKWLANLAQMDAENLQRILNTPPEYFSEVMRKWASAWLTPQTYRANLTEDQLSEITIPAVVLPNHEPVHPMHTGVELARLLPNATMPSFDSKHTNDAVTQFESVDNQPPSTQCAFYAPFYEDFVRDVEAEAFVAD